MYHHTPARPALRTGAAGLAALAVLAMSGGGANAAPAPGRNQLVGYHDVNGSQAGGRTSANGSAQVTSYDGRYVVFSTSASLVPQDTNRVDDVYRRDTVAGRTTLVSVAANGKLGNDYSFEPTISDDGTKVAFTTWSTNLLGDTNGDALDVLVKDLTSGRLERASVKTDGSQTRRNSFFPVISGDGSAVAFQSFGRFSAKDRDRTEDVYVRDLTSGRTRQASLDAKGADIKGGHLVGDISDDGRLVTFGNDHDAWVRDLGTGRSTLVWHEGNDPRQPFPMGTVGRPVVSGDGRFVAFSTMSNDVVAQDKGHSVDIFRVALGSGKVQKVTLSRSGGQANGDSFIPSLSRSGRFVGFSSFAGNLTGGEGPGSDTFVRDMRKGRTYLASAALAGVANQESGRSAVAISGNGRALAYETYASNLVPKDTNGRSDVVVWKR